MASARWAWPGAGARPPAGGGHSLARGCARLGLEFQYKQGPRLDRRVFPFFLWSTLPSVNSPLRAPRYGSQEAEARSSVRVSAPGHPAAGWREQAARSPGAAQVRRRLSSAPRSGGDPRPASAGEARDLGVPAPAASVPRAAGLLCSQQVRAEHWEPGDRGIWGRRAAPRPSQAFCLEILDLEGLESRSSFLLSL